ncbi:hypothetical protein BsWGS_28297 [Bradybaena similaris]
MQTHRLRTTNICDEKCRHRSTDLVSFVLVSPLVSQIRHPQVVTSTALCTGHVSFPCSCDISKTWGQEHTSWPEWLELADVFARRWAPGYPEQFLVSRVFTLGHSVFTPGHSVFTPGHSVFRT